MATQNKAQALQSFWSQFNADAYDENTVPENAPFPRITWNYSQDEWDRPVAMSASIWDRSYSWVTIQGIADSIFEEIGFGGTLVACDGGNIWIKRGAPFCQRMGDEDDAIRRIYINIEAEFLSAL